VPVDAIVLSQSDNFPHGDALHGCGGCRTDKGSPGGLNILRHSVNKPNPDQSRGRALVCPATHHIRVKRLSMGSCHLTEDDRVNGTALVDVLFHSLAKEFGRQGVAYS